MLLSLSIHLLLYFKLRIALVWGMLICFIGTAISDGDGNLIIGDEFVTMLSFSIFIRSRILQKVKCKLNKYNKEDSIRRLYNSYVDLSFFRHFLRIALIYRPMSL